MKSIDVQRMAHDPGLFRQSLVIDESGKTLGSCIESWQRADFEAMDRGWLQAIGRETFDPATIRRAYHERPRGHSKTSDIAVSIIFAMAFTARRLFGVVAAADRDQAKLVRDAIDRLVYLNPWLNEVIKVNQYEVMGRHGSRVEIISADAGSAYGHTPDFVVADELTHWQPSGEALWTAVASSAAKRPHCLLLVISNAGVGQGSSWQWRVREVCRESSEWHFSRLEGPKAKWISEAVLAEQRKLLTAKAFARLWLNQWQLELGDALPGSDIDAALARGTEIVRGKRPGWVYGLGVDLGLRRDATGIVVTARDPRTQRYELVEVRRFAPLGDKAVEVSQVEDTIRELHQTYRFTKGYVDGWQALYLAERLDKSGIKLAPLMMNLSVHDELSRLLISVFGDGMIALFDHGRLMAELRSTSIVEGFAGKLKLVWVRDEHGHGDCASAFCLSLKAAKEAYSREIIGFPLARPSSISAETFTNDLLMSGFRRH